MPLFIKKSIFIMKSMVAHRIVAPEEEALARVVTPALLYKQVIMEVSSTEQHSYYYYYYYLVLFLLLTAVLDVANCVNDIIQQY